MSLIKCKECEKKIAKGCKSCPNCGSKKNRSYLRRHPFISIIIFFSFFGIFSQIMYNNTPQSNMDINSKKELSVKENKLNVINDENTNRNEILKNTDNNNGENINQKSSWNYSNSKDEMRGLDYNFAINSSLDTKDLGFPYQDSKLDIILRNFDNKNEVLIKVVGIFSCIDRECVAEAKFDDEPIKKYTFSISNDSRSNVIFIDNSKDFISKIKKSKKLILEVPIFQHGDVQYRFDTSNIKWNY